jgi:hypothetical protein
VLFTTGTKGVILTPLIVLVLVIVLVLDRFLSALCHVRARPLGPVPGPVPRVETWLKPWAESSSPFGAQHDWR